MRGNAFHSVEATASFLTFVGSDLSFAQAPGSLGAIWPQAGGCCLDIEGTSNYVLMYISRRTGSILCSGLHLFDEDWC